MNWTDGDDPNRIWIDKGESMPAALGCVLVYGAALGAVGLLVVFAIARAFGWEF